MTTESRELIATEVDQVLPAIADTALVSLAEQAEKRVEAMVKIKRMALKLTNAHDWVDQDGKPYLQASGGEKVGRLFGVSWRIDEPTEEKLEAGHYMITYTGEFSLAGSYITAVGTRASNDDFFTVRYEGTGESRHKVKLPASEVDRGNVKKSAFSNLLANGIGRLLGIRNLTWEDLKEYAGITREQVTSIQYKKGGKPNPQGKAAAPQGKQPSGPGPSEAQVKAGRALLQVDKPTITDPDAPATEAQVKAIHGILAAMGINDQLARHEKVRDILSLEAVPTSMGKLSKTEASQVIKELQAEQGGE